jgi:hypothetical protein
MNIVIDCVKSWLAAQESFKRSVLLFSGGEFGLVIFYHCKSILAHHCYFTRRIYAAQCTSIIGNLCLLWSIL